MSVKQKIQMFSLTLFNKPNSTGKYMNRVKCVEDHHGYLFEDLEGG
jgi:hypothetical protein